MNVWTLEYQDPNDVSNNTNTVWDSERAAQKQVCHYIMNEGSNWDIEDPDMEAVARRINDAVACGDYKQALSEYNDNSYGDHYYVNETDLQSMSDADEPDLITFSDPDEDEDSEEEDESDDDEGLMPYEPANYRATSPGATCRGPCKQVSPDAYADQVDGTYVCYSCKYMKQVFGG